jgi:hypothetical protein
MNILFINADGVEKDNASETTPKAKFTTNFSPPWRLTELLHK